MHSISKISKNGTYLQVIWDDGKESKFNYMWLRDNCPTAHDKDSRHRMFNILDVSENINPKKYNLNSDGKLEIEWSEGNHVSYYDINWLRENCYTINNKKKYDRDRSHDIKLLKKGCFFNNFDFFLYFFV